MSKDELLKAIEKARKNVRYMSKSGQTNTVHHENLAWLEAELAGKKEYEPAKSRKELKNG